ncbi:MAG: cache domain-containing protein [Rubrivivax sp.]
MNFLSRILITIAAAVGLTTTALAQDHGSRDDAKAMVDAALAHVKKVGPEKAFEDFSKDKAAWTKKDLYVFAMDFDGVNKAHGANEKLIGKALIGLKDQQGKEFVKEMVAVGSGKGEGWVDYDWANPVTKKVEGKSSYVKRIAGTSYLLAVGIYR